MNAALLSHLRTLLILPLVLLGLALQPATAYAADQGCGAWSSSWAVDGLYGPATQVAVKRYQRARHLKDDGIAGPITLKALGKKAPRLLHCGSSGNDVRALQQALKATGVWGVSPKPSAAKPKPKPTKKPDVIIPIGRSFTPKPTPTPPDTERLPIATPTPMMSAPPVTPDPFMTVPTPTPMATARPTPLPVSDEQRDPTLGLRGGVFAAAPIANPTAFQPLYFGEGSLWIYGWGLGVDALGTGNLTLDGTTPVGLLYDVVLERRLWTGSEIFLGYQGIGTGSANMLTGGLGLDRAIVGQWLRLQARIQASTNFGDGLVADGRLGLGFGLGPLVIEVGGRGLQIQGASLTPGGTSTLVGPYGSLQLMF